MNGQAPYWTQPEAALAASLQSGPAGLGTAQAAALLARHGPNAIADTARNGAIRLLLRQFESPLVIILVVAAVIALAVREWLDASIILAIVLGSCLLGFWQEYRASTAVEELKKRLALTCRVLRDGAERVLPVSVIVPGDVILLAAGNLIPADGRVLEAEDFLVSESAMTGESFPVEKRPGSVAADAGLPARTNSVFLGASVRSGTAKVLAVRTGRETEFGAIAARLRERAPETDFARGIRQFGYLLVRVMLGIVLLVLAANLAQHRPVIDSLLFSVALAVGLSPELLPAIISVTLSAGARRMGQRGVIVRRLEAIENLGSMDVLCTDKTGTLTQGTIVLAATLGSCGAEDPEIRRLAFLNAALETGIANPLDAAITAAGAAAGLTTAGLITDGHAKVDEIPYDFVRRRLTIVVSVPDMPGRHRVITKGAFANVLEACGFIDQGGVTRPLTDQARAGLEAIFTARGQEGFRVLALATRDVAAQPRYSRDDEREMVFRGFLVFLDPPKPDAARIIADLARLGIAIKVISGDNRHVTAHLAHAVGIDATAMLTGEQIAAMRDESLWHLAPRTQLFVEIDPQQKERIVRALQRTGHSVGYMGDGINDAPALHAADVGISVERAVDVARESADIILLRGDLDVLRTGVEEGRHTFANTLKYIAMAISSNFGNMVSMAIAAPLLPFLPLAAKQILLNNLLADTAAIAISTDNVDPDRIAAPQRWNIADIRRFMIVFGLVSSVFDLLTFATLLFVFHAGEATFQTAWFVISVFTELAAVLVLRTRQASVRSRPSTMLLCSVGAVAAFTVAIPFLDGFAVMFGFVPLTTKLLAASAAIVAGYMASIEVAKVFYFRPARR